MCTNIGGVLAVVRPILRCNCTNMGGVVAVMGPILRCICSHMGGVLAIMGLYYYVCVQIWVGCWLSWGLY